MNALDHFRLVKNTAQFFLSVVLFVIIYHQLNWFKVVLGLLSFLITYHAVYFFNDFLDYEVDKKDAVRAHIKPLPAKQYTKEEAISLMFICIISGLALSFLVNIHFSAALLILLFLNFLYSSKFTRWKKTKLKEFIMFLTETIKFSVGWFALGGALNTLPILVILPIASVYAIIAYYFYKKHLTKKHFYLGFFTVSVILYFLAIHVYPFKVPLLINMILVPIIAYRFRHLIKTENGSPKIGFKIADGPGKLTRKAYITPAVLCLFEIVLLIDLLPWVQILNGWLSFL